MRKELRRSLFAAACAGVALAGCGGNSSSSTSSGGVPAPAPSPSPSPTPASAGSYLLIGRAGGTTGAVANIPFADSSQGPSPFGLSYIDPANLPPPFAVDNFQFQIEAGGTVLPLASVSEYFPNGAGSASAWGTRYRVYAKASGNSAGLLYAVDLRETVTPATAPTPVQLTSNTVSGMKLCSTPPVVFDNYRSANLSWILFHVLGPDINCGTLDDQYLAIQLSMGPSSTALSLGQVEPVEAIYDGQGAITGVLAISHPSVDGSGNPTTPVPLELLNANLASPQVFSTKLQGKGLNAAGGDFLSLGVASGNLWLYWDSTAIYGVNLATGVTTQIAALQAGDTVNGRAVFDSTSAYVAVNNTAVPPLGSQIIKITLASGTATPGPRDTTLSNITLVGATTGAVVYFGTTAATPAVTNLRTTLKSTLALNATPLNNTLSGTQTIDSLMGPSGSAGGPVAFVVGDTVFFTVADTAPGTTGFAKQAFYVTFNTSGTPGTATAIAANVGAVLGVVAPSPISTSGSYTNIGALVMTMGSNAASGATAPGGAAFAAGPTAGCASPSTCASLGLYSASGLPVQTVVGSLGSTSLSSGVALLNPIYSVAFDEGPVQSGMPAMLQLTGTAGGAPAEDMVVYTPNTASSLTQVSGFSQ
jgi:hypothetical protein